MLQTKPVYGLNVGICRTFILENLSNQRCSNVACEITIRLPVHSIFLYYFSVLLILTVCWFLDTHC